MILNVVAGNHSGSDATRTMVANTNTQRSSGVSASSPPLSSICVLARLLPFENKTSTLSLEIPSSSMGDTSAAVAGTGGITLTSNLGLPACSTDSTSAVAGTHNINPLGNYVWSTKAERLTVTTWLNLKKRLSSSCSPSPEYQILALATIWWGLTHHQWHQQSKHPKIKLTFRLKRKPQSLQRPRQVVRHNPLLPPMPRSVSRSLSL